MLQRSLGLALLLTCFASGCGDDEDVIAGDAAIDDDADVTEADAAVADDAGEDAGEPDSGPPAIEPNQAGLTIELSDGVLEGAMVEGTRVFSGIPFAAPPVGELRFAPPQPVEPWPGMLDATGPGVACPQNDEQLADGSVEKSEDCLQLNVFAPQEPPDAPLPVMVWIHGGSNVNGSANQVAGADLPRIFDGAVLRADAARDVVVVTINYRMGALGFLAHRDAVRRVRRRVGHLLSDGGDEPRRLVPARDPRERQLHQPGDDARAGRGLRGRFRRARRLRRG